MQNRWTLLEQPKNSELEPLQEALKIDLLTAAVLWRRGIRSREAAFSFFQPDLSQLLDPFALKNMDAAVKWLDNIITKKQKILLYGDYDVDGTTSVAMMYRFLRENEVPVQYYVPDRYSEGYGVSDKGIDWALEQGFDGLVTLDCGIKNPQQLQRAFEGGIEVVVCDHHEAGEVLPPGIILNPKQPDCDYINKSLCGCALAYKWLTAYAEFKKSGRTFIDSLLDFVAIATGADIVSVLGENRVLCTEGLKYLNAEPRAVWKELMSSANKSFPLTLTDVVFGIAPRINAAGRLQHGRTAVEMMIAEDLESIRQLASDIEEFNAERRLLDEQTTREALKVLQEEEIRSPQKTSVVAGENWSKGVVGIVASRLQESYHRPTVVLTAEKENYTGSARSVNGFDIHKALLACSDLFEKFGGHQFAAGLTLRKDNLRAFKDRFENYVNENITPAELLPELRIEQEIDFNAIYRPGESVLGIPRLVQIIQKLEPFGPDNLQPVFLTKQVFATEVYTMKEKHLKLKVQQADSLVSFTAVAFNQADKIDEVSAGLSFDLVYTFSINEWKGNKTLQLMVRDIQPATFSQ